MRARRGPDDRRRVPARRLRTASGHDSWRHRLMINDRRGWLARALRDEHAERGCLSASRPFDVHATVFVMVRARVRQVPERHGDAVARGGAEISPSSAATETLRRARHQRAAPEGRGALPGHAVRPRRRAARAGGRRRRQRTARGRRRTTSSRRSPFAASSVSAPRRSPSSRPGYTIGHLISAAGAVEAVAAIVRLRRGMLHPTINLHDPILVRARLRAQRGARSRSVIFFLLLRLRRTTTPPS